MCIVFAITIGRFFNTFVRRMLYLNVHHDDREVLNQTTRSAKYSEQRNTRLFIVWYWTDVESYPNS